MRRCILIFGLLIFFLLLAVFTEPKKESRFVQEFDSTIVVSEKLAMDLERRDSIR